MKLKTLVKDEKDLLLKSSHNPEITGLNTHSKSIKPGELYIAFKGSAFDGRDFIHEALKSGAAGVITDLYNPLLDKKFVQVITKNPQVMGQKLALKFYKKAPWLIGITGTNGKTTTAFCIKQLFDLLGFRLGLVGTCMIDTLFSQKEAFLTTPDGVFLSRLIQETQDAGGVGLVTEVSSHALDQNRILGHVFDVTVFTNLTHDHLDYHKTFEAYQEAKLKLFLDNYLPKTKAFALINLDDPYAETIISKTRREVITYSLKNPKADFYLKDLTVTKEVSRGNLIYQKTSYPFKSPLLGDFNASNILAALACASLIEKDVNKILAQLEFIQGAPGRLQKVQSNIYIDYAHTPDGLESVLKTLKQLPFKKLKVLFGCGGDRDKDKRPLMGQIAETWADDLIITSDNPRFEEPAQILDEIKKGLKNPLKARCIVDREEAIFEACRCLEDDTLLLVAGKGHEKFQLVKHEKIPFDEAELIQQAMVKHLSS